MEWRRNTKILQLFSNTVVVISSFFFSQFSAPDYSIPFLTDFSSLLSLEHINPEAKFCASESSSSSKKSQSHEPGMTKYYVVRR